MKYDPALRTKLPSKLIKSRLCHAEIWAGYSSKKRVIAVLLKLSRSSHAFIISQGGIPGFLLPHNIVSWIYEFIENVRFRERISKSITSKEITEFSASIAAIDSVE